MNELRVYYVSTEFGEVLIKDEFSENPVKTLDDAIDVVMDSYVNTGKRIIIEKIYTYKDENKHIVNTNWK